MVWQECQLFSKNYPAHGIIFEAKADHPFSALPVCLGYTPSAHFTTSNHGTEQRLSRNYPATVDARLPSQLRKIEICSFQGFLSHQFHGRYFAVTIFPAYQCFLWILTPGRMTMVPISHKMIDFSEILHTLFPGVEKEFDMGLEKEKQIFDNIYQGIDGYSISHKGRRTMDPEDRNFLIYGDVSFADLLTIIENSGIKAEIRA
jgi:hypothetical protein